MTTQTDVCKKRNYNSNMRRDTNARTSVEQASSHCVVGVTCIVYMILTPQQQGSFLYAEGDVPTHAHQQSQRCYLYCVRMRERERERERDCVSQRVRLERHADTQHDMIHEHVSGTFVLCERREETHGHLRAHLSHSINECISLE